MAGRPIYRESVARIEDKGGEHYVLETIMDGHPTAVVAAVCDISRGMLYEWLHKDSERWERYQEARRVGAHVLAEQALEIVDDATSETISVDRERARIRQWLAERANPKDFGKEGAGVNLQLSIGDLHLQAVKQLPAQDIEEAEYEVLPELEDLL